MITEIGIAAGEVWQYLDKNGEVQLSVLFTKLKKSRELILMSVGWLSREGHVILTEDGDDFWICLRK